MTDGAQRRDFLHVTDAGRALAALADSSLTGAVNIASGEGLVLADLARRIASLTGGVELLRMGALPQRENEPPCLVADVSRLRQELGWRPRIGLEDGLRDTVAWWRERL
jgi:nucleoside-diphosphate-sugar epimerase